MFLKLGITKPCTQLVSTSTQFIEPPPSSLQHPQRNSNLNIHVSSNFSKFRPKNSKLSMFTENWPVRELGGADSKSRVSFLKFGSQNPFLGKFGPKKSKLLVLPENWHTWYLEDVYSYSNISLLNLQP